MFISYLQWPPVPTTKVFKLALIRKEKIQRGRIDDEFIRLSITGKVDDILQYKTPVEIKNLFRECQNGHNFVLIEGAPGSGKSTLALHICQEWAEEKLFQEYDVMILVRLRDPLIRKARTVADLLPCVDRAMAVETEATIKKLFGKGVLWVLDGWDELPSDLPPDSIIHKLVQPGMYQENPIVQSSLIITSRPSSSSKLHPLVSTRVEVLGFTPHELEQYFRECLKNDSGAVQTLLERVRENPVVEGSCYLPLNASIVVHVFLSGHCTLPTSIHGIFISVVQSSLKRYLWDKLGKTTTVGDILCPESLPLEIRCSFEHLCQLAFYGVEENRVTFTESDLTTLSITEDVSQVGLMQKVYSIISDGHQVYFCFLHLSIQELLAAVYISWMSPKQQISIFQELFGTLQFSGVFQFYAGITKLRTSRPFLSKLPKFLYSHPSSVRSILTSVVKKELQKPRRESKSLLVSLLHCLNEAEDPSLCVFMADLLNYKLDLGFTTLSPHDCLSVGYFLSVVCTSFSSEFVVNLNYCSIGDQGCKFLTKGICKCLHSQSRVTSELDVYLWYNGINEDGVYHLTKLLNIAGLICSISLTGNDICDSGLKHICEALVANTTLEQLSLFHCLQTISDENGSYFYQLLTTNTSLSSLNLAGTKITNCCHIAAGLTRNKSLRRLVLSYCNLTDESIRELCTGLNNYIEKLDIRGNGSITIVGLKILGNCVADLSGLKYLILPSHLESSLGSVFQEVNEGRSRKKLPQIDVGGRLSLVILVRL